VLAPEMAKHHDIVYPEYRDADTADEIVKAVRENMLFGAKVIKICVDCKPWGYSVDAGCRGGSAPRRGPRPHTRSSRPSGPSSPRTPAGPRRSRARPPSGPGRLEVHEDP
jgi:hypothetical protein